MLMQLLAFWITNLVLKIQARHIKIRFCISRVSFKHTEVQSALIQCIILLEPASPLPRHDSHYLPHQPSIIKLRKSSPRGHSPLHISYHFVIYNLPHTYHAPSGRLAGRPRLQAGLVVTCTDRL